MQSKENLQKSIGAGLLKWYDFRLQSRILYIGESKEAVIEDLRELNLCITNVIATELFDVNWLNQNRKAYDYVICVGWMEKVFEPSVFLNNCKQLLSTGGILLLGMNNRLGLRYWCGDRDIYTNRNFDGIENYGEILLQDHVFGCGRMYSRAEIKTLLTAVGFTMQFFAVLPDLDNPFFFFAEKYVPNENLGNRVFPIYNYPDTVFLKEEQLYSTMIENNIFYAMSNAYLIECTVDGTLSAVQHVTCSIERGRENALATIIHTDKTVEKRALYSEGQARINTLAKNTARLKQNGIAVVEGKLCDNRYIMPYIEANTCQLYFEKLLLADKDKFLCEFDRFVGDILRSSEIATPDNGDGYGAILKQGFVDLVPLNSFYVDDLFVFFDQEFCVENYPANVIVWRAIFSFYAANNELNKILPIDAVYKRYGIDKYLSRWTEIDCKFISKIRNDAVLSDYHVKVRRNNAVVIANRNRMNYSAIIYDKHIRTMLDKADTRKLILFGSGKYAANFLERFGKDYNLYAIIDNNEQRYGEMMGGVQICAPDMLKTLSIGEYKVIICVKDYAPIAKQLEKSGVYFYGIYNPAFSYSFSHRLKNQNKDISPKKFHIGYIAGVFDLYHVGHLNMFRRAKQQCDYLIVGVVTDRGVREGKKVEPFVPFEERMELVQACRYVDEAVTIPIERPDTDYAWERYNFDVQFSGSDYEHDPVWLAKKKFLEERGATMMFFPYTQSTSSTKIKQLIEKRLM